MHKLISSCLLAVALLPELVTSRQGASSSGGAATSITEGTTTVTGCTNDVLYGDGSGVVGCEAALGYDEATNTLTGTNVTGTTTIGTTTIGAVGANGTANAVYLTSANMCFEGSAADGNDLCFTASTVNSNHTITFTIGGAVTWSTSASSFIFSTPMRFNSGFAGLRIVEVNTTAKTPTDITESFEIYTNTGDADGSTITLTDNPTAGMIIGPIIAVAAQNITIAASAGETLMFGNTTCATSIVVGGAATGIGDSVTIVAATGGSGALWVVTASAGTPVCT